MHADVHSNATPCHHTFRPIPTSTPLLTLPGAYIKPHGNVVELGTYRDQQLVYEHPDDHDDQEDPEMESIMNKIDLLKVSSVVQLLRSLIH